MIPTSKYHQNCTKPASAKIRRNVLFMIEHLNRFYVFYSCLFVLKLNKFENLPPKRCLKKKVSFQCLKYTFCIFIASFNVKLKEFFSFDICLRSDIKWKCFLLCRRKGCLITLLLFNHSCIFSHKYQIKAITGELFMWINVFYLIFI
jgi:hypothetical protein